MAVSASFLQMKARSLSGELSRPLLLEVPETKRKQIRTRALTALDLNGFVATAEKIRSCGRDSLCSNPYCLKCWKRMVSQYESRIWQRVNDRYNGSIKDANRNFRFFTILQDWVAPEPEAVLEAMDEMQEGLRTLRRQLGKPWLHGAYDFELTDVGRVLFGGVACPWNTDIMTTIAGPKAFTLDHAVAVHCHGIIDKEERRDADVKECLAGIWNRHPRQIEVKKFYKNPRKIPNPTLEDSFRYNVAAISEYMFKREHEYKFTIDDNVRSKGDYLNNRYQGILANLYSSLGGQGYHKLLIWSKGGKDQEG